MALSTAAALLRNVRSSLQIIGTTVSATTYTPGTGVAVDRTVDNSPSTSVDTILRDVDGRILWARVDNTGTVIGNPKHINSPAQLYDLFVNGASTLVASPRFN